MTAKSIIHSISFGVFVSIIISYPVFSEEGSARVKFSSKRILADVDENIPIGEKAGKYDIAVIIGNKNYFSKSEIPDVEYADRDAQTMKQYLERTFGYDSENIIYVEDATTGKFNELFGVEGKHEEV